MLYINVYWAEAGLAVAERNAEKKLPPLPVFLEPLGFAVAARGERTFAGTGWCEGRRGSSGAADNSAIGGKEDRENGSIVLSGGGGIGVALDFLPMSDSNEF